MLIEEKKGYTYIFKNSNTGQFYIGSTSNYYERTWRHINQLSRGIHGNRKFQEAYNKDQNFECSIVFEGSRNEAYGKEQELLDLYCEAVGLLNISTDARASQKGRPHTEETKQKMVESRKGVVLPPWTDEQRRNQSIAQTGRKHSEETIEKCRLARLGKARSEETKKRMSLGQKRYFLNNPVSEETRRKQSESRSGVSRPRHVIDAMIQANIKPIEYEGINYPSIRSVIESSGFCKTTTQRLLKRYIADDSKNVTVKRVIMCNFCDSVLKEEFTLFDPCRFQLLIEKDTKHYVGVSTSQYEGFWYDNDFICNNCK